MKKLNSRIDLRVTQEQKEFFKRASVYGGFKNITEFIIFSTERESNRLLTEDDILLKNEEDKKIFVKELLYPSPPNDRLKKALETRNKLKNE